MNYMKQSKELSHMGLTDRGRGSSYWMSALIWFVLLINTVVKVHWVPAKIASGWHASGRTKPFPLQINTMSWKPPSNKQNKLWDKNEHSSKDQLQWPLSVSIKTIINHSFRNYFPPIRRKCDHRVQSVPSFPEVVFFRFPSLSHFMSWTPPLICVGSAQYCNARTQWASQWTE